jgi:hypothetical protein
MKEFQITIDDYPKPIKNCLFKCPVCGWRCIGYNDGYDTPLSVTIKEHLKEIIYPPEPNIPLCLRCIAKAFGMNKESEE